ncbi:glycoside hydrolase family 16 protein [Mycolicibacterium chlorophenolicum]|uniref:Glycosyl hydrolases family 16 n=1 Tax=Mycolicibacterium chlorophenolicum TaxID=37916 RepID=A0A0J6VGD9_9MYCO|nr:glycoside hydrolase family 16 protein [Mycolicibacterium chlorophenolicum]KMO68518.1 Glycosyl hydrolases family 16 [Mycolicibacterium chlorophenolicum]
MAAAEFDKRFTDLDVAVWTTSYLPAWSSHAEASATYDVGPEGLDLFIPSTQGLWCADLHDGPLRVSAIQSANRSGPVGSTDAPQPFREGLLVREEQPTVLGFVPHFGTLSVTCSAQLSPRSMFSAWMVGLEDQPERCGEICVMEVFGDSVVDGRAAVGQGIHRFRDPALREDFSADPQDIDIEREHTYSVHWAPGSVEFAIDGVTTRTTDQSPDYPMFLILGVFDFPDRPGTADHVPHLHVSRVTYQGLY